MRKIHAREYQANVLRLQEENFELKMQLSDLTKRFEAFLSSHNIEGDLAKTLAEQESLIHSLQSKINDLTSNIESPRSALLIAENKLARARDQIEASVDYGKYEDLEKQIQELQHQNDDLADENMNLRDRLEELEAQFASQSYAMSSKSSSRVFSVSSKAPSESAGDPYDLRSPFDGAKDWRAKCKELEDEIAQCLETNKQLSTELANLRLRSKRTEHFPVLKFQQRFNEMLSAYSQEIGLKMQEFEDAILSLEGSVKEFAKPGSLLSSSSLDTGSEGRLSARHEGTPMQNPLLAFLTEPGNEALKPSPQKKVTFTVSEPQTNEIPNENYVPSPILKKRTPPRQLIASSPQASERQGRSDVFVVSSPTGVDLPRSTQTALSSPKGIERQETHDMDDVYQTLLDTVWDEFCDGKAPEFHLLDSNRVRLLASIIEKKMDELRRQIEETKKLTRPVDLIIRQTRMEFRGISDRLHTEHMELMNVITAEKTNQ